MLSINTSMIGKQIKGTSFRGVLNYMDAKVKAGVGVLIDTNMFGRNIKELSKEFGVIRTIKPNVSKVVYHCALSIQPHEKLTTEQFANLGKEYLEKMGFDNSQYVIYSHSDKEHPHIHLVANRISMTGEIVSDKWDFKRSEQIIRQLELKFGIEQTISSDNINTSSLSKGQVELFRRTGEVPIKMQLQMIINEAIKISVSMNDFTNCLSENGVKIQQHKNSIGNVFGVSFELDGIAFKGSDLGRSFSWKKISNQIHNNYERDSRKDQTSNRGEVTNSKGTSFETSENKRREYSTTKTGNDSDSKKYEDSVGFSNRGSSPISATNGEIGETKLRSGTTIELNDKQIDRTETSEYNSEFENVSDGDFDRFNVGDFFVSTVSIPKVGHHNEDDDILKKKKKKGKNQWMSR